MGPHHFIRIVGYDTARLVVEGGNLAFRKVWRYACRCGAWANTIHEESRLLGSLCLDLSPGLPRFAWQDGTCGEPSKHPGGGYLKEKAE